MKEGQATKIVITAEGVTLILPGSQVLCARDSGTIVVMGNIV